MAIINVGKVAGIINSENPPPVTDVLWGQILNPSFPQIVEIHYFDDLTLQWTPITDPTTNYWLRPVIDDGITTPPSSPSNGDRYIVPIGATGAWAGQDLKVTEYKVDTWTFQTPIDGYIVSVRTKTNKLYDFQGTWGSGGIWNENDFQVPISPDDLIPRDWIDIPLGVSSLDENGNIPIGNINPDTLVYNPNAPGSWPGGTDTIKEALDYLITIAAPSIPVYTASNGLNKSGNDIRLGGILIQNTSIDGDSNTYNLELINFLSLTLGAVGINVNGDLVLAGNIDITGNVSITGVFTIDPSIPPIDDGGTLDALVWDSSTGEVKKRAVTGGGGLTPRNGLVTDGGFIELGGTLIEDTSIDLSGFVFSLEDAGVVFTLKDNSVNLSDAYLSYIQLIDMSDVSVAFIGHTSALNESFYISNFGQDDIILETNNDEVFRITPTGNVTISNAGAGSFFFDGTSNNEKLGIGELTPGDSIHISTLNPGIRLENISGTTSNSEVFLSYFHGSDIRAQIGFADTANDTDGNLIFYVKQDGGSLIQRLFIQHDGVINIGADNSYLSHQLNITTGIDDSLRITHTSITGNPTISFYQTSTNIAEFGYDDALDSLLFSNKHIQYDNDYSLFFTDRSLVDRGYVTNYFSGETFDLTGAADNDMLFRSGGEWVDTGGLLTWDGNTFKVAGIISPEADGTRDIGTTSLRFKDIFVSGDVKNLNGNTTYWKTDGTTTIPTQAIIDLVTAPDQAIRFNLPNGSALNPLFIGINGQGGGIGFGSEGSGSGFTTILRPIGTSKFKIVHASTGAFEIFTNRQLTLNQTTSVGTGITLNTTATGGSIKLQRALVTKFEVADTNKSHVQMDFVEITPPTVDTLGQGIFYASNIDGLPYWRTAIGEAFTFWKSKGTFTVGETGVSSTVAAIASSTSLRFDLSAGSSVRLEASTSDGTSYTNYEGNLITNFLSTAGGGTWNAGSAAEKISIVEGTGQVDVTGKLTTTGQILAGSATHPNLSFVDDSDTGFSASGNTLSVYNNGQIRWVFIGGSEFRATQNKVANLGLSTSIWNNFYSVTNWQSEQAPPISGDITGLGRTYVSDVDGLYYFRDELGNVYRNSTTLITGGSLMLQDADPDLNLTGVNGAIAYDTTDHEFRAYINGNWTALSEGGGGSPGGAEHELQENDGAGGFRGTKVFSSVDGSLVLGDSALSGDRAISIQSLDTDANLIISPKNAGAVFILSSGGSVDTLWVGNSLGNTANLFVAGNSTSTTFLTVANTNTSGGNAKIAVNQSQETGGGDPYYQVQVGGTRSYIIGIDNSDLNKLKITTDTTAIVTPSTGTELMVLTSDGLITWNQTLNDATGDEVAFTISPTINKLTSGNYTGLLIDVTETAAPGTDNRLIDLKVGGSGVFAAYPTGSLTLGKDTLDFANANYIGLEYPRGVGHIAKIALTGNPESYYFNNLYHNGTNWVHKETNTSAIYALGWNGHFFYANESKTADTAAVFLLGLSITNASSVVEVSVAPSAGAKLGFFGAAASVVSTGWAVSNVTPDKVYDANATNTDELADVLGTLINELITKGLISA
jgi:hypothetical protein